MPVDTSIGRLSTTYLFRKVSCGDAQLFGAAAKAPYNLPAAEVRQEPHDAICSACGLLLGARSRGAAIRAVSRSPGPAGGHGREHGPRTELTYNGLGGAGDQPRQAPCKADLMVFVTEVW